jgi:hypothetical protein
MLSKQDMRFGVIPVSGLVTKRLGLSDIIMTVYTIYINGTEKYTDVSEDEFFDIMQELAFDHYETGVPALNDISYRMKEDNG